MVTTKIRRDQWARIKDITDNHTKFPIVAIGLIRDLVKHTSLREVVDRVTFSDGSFTAIEDLAPQPKFITVITKGYDRSSTELLGTSYHFSLCPEKKHEAPIL